MITRFEPAQPYCLALQGKRSFELGKEGVVDISRDGLVVTVLLTPGCPMAQLAGERLVFSPTGVTAENGPSRIYETSRTAALLDGSHIPERTDMAGVQAFADHMVPPAPTTPQPAPIDPDVAASVEPFVKADPVGPPPHPSAPQPIFVPPPPSGLKPGRRS